MNKTVILTHQGSDHQCARSAFHQRPRGGSTRPFSRRRRTGSTVIRRRCACAARPWSIRLGPHAGVRRVLARPNQPVQMTSGRHQGRTELDSRNCAALIRQPRRGRGAPNRGTNRAFLHSLDRYRTSDVKAAIDSSRFWSPIMLAGDERADTRSGLRAILAALEDPVLGRDDQHGRPVLCR